MERSPVLPEPVSALAGRLGARHSPGARAHFRQSGTLRNIGQAKWMRFTARQWLASDAPCFRWRARVGPLGAVHVEDALIDGRPVGRASALGLVTLERAEPSPELLQGELQRYLAELMWNPDALLSNSGLCWEVRGADELAVTARLDGVAGSVTIHLGADGLPERTHALRPAREDGGYRLRDWHGVFADYREVAGRMIPHSGRVAWQWEGERFEVWRGTIEGWHSEGG